MVEFGLILPVLLTLLGASVDLARLYQAWINLQSATRSAAEYAATNDQTQASAQSDAKASVCTQVTGSASCTSPSVTVPSFALATDGTIEPGATTANPVATVTVSSTMQFRTLFAYPFFTQNGAWTLSSTESFKVIQGRP
jgi:Flp pilus assembly protein TadG